MHSKAKSDFMVTDCDTCVRGCVGNDTFERKNYLCNIECIK